MHRARGKTKAGGRRGLLEMHARGRVGSIWGPSEIRIAR